MPTSKAEKTDFLFTECGDTTDDKWFTKLLNSKIFLQESTEVIYSKIIRIREKVIWEATHVEYIHSKILPFIVTNTW